MFAAEIKNADISIVLNVNDHKRLCQCLTVYFIIRHDTRIFLSSNSLLSSLLVKDDCPLSYLWQCVRKGVDTGLRLAVCVRVHKGPWPLLYAGAQSEGIIDIETNSLSSQPPQNRNTPIIKEREAERERRWVQKESQRNIGLKRRSKKRKQICQIENHIHI